MRIFCSTHISSTYYRCASNNSLQQSTLSGYTADECGGRLCHDCNSKSIVHVSYFLLQPKHFSSIQSPSFLIDMMAMNNTMNRNWKRCRWGRHLRSRHYRSSWLCSGLDHILTTTTAPISLVQTNSLIQTPTGTRLFGLVRAYCTLFLVVTVSFLLSFPAILRVHTIVRTCIHVCTVFVTWTPCCTALKNPGERRTYTLWWCDC